MPQRASNQQSTDSRITLFSTKGSVYFTNAKGLSAKTCKLPHTNPLARDSPLSEYIEILRVHMKNWFSGVDFFKTILENFELINDEDQVFISVVPGEFDTNGLYSDAYRRKMGKICSAAFLGNDDSTFYDHAMAKSAQLGHPSMAFLMSDHDHW